MQPTDIIRAVLDMLDNLDKSAPNTTSDYNGDGKLDPHERDHEVEKPLIKTLDRDNDGDHDMDDHMQPNIEITTDVPPEEGEPIASRFKQIFTMLNNPTDGDYANTPNEIVAPVSAVTTDAGGGLNGPKDPADIRVKDSGAY